MLVSECSSMSLTCSSSIYHLSLKMLWITDRAASAWLLPLLMRANVVMTNSCGELKRVQVS